MIPNTTHLHLRLKYRYATRFACCLKAYIHYPYNYYFSDIQIKCDFLTTKNDVIGSEIALSILIHSAHPTSNKHFKMNLIRIRMNPLITLFLLLSYVEISLAGITVRKIVCFHWMISFNLNLFGLSVGW